MSAEFRMMNEHGSRHTCAGARIPAIVGMAPRAEFANPESFRTRKQHTWMVAVSTWMARVWVNSPRGNLSSPVCSIYCATVYLWATARQTSIDLCVIRFGPLERLYASKLSNKVFMK